LTATTPAQATPGQRMTAAYLNQFIPGPVTAITSFSNGWANRGAGNTPFSVRLINSVTVHITGQVVAGTLTASTQMAALPALSWAPIEACVVPAWNEQTGACHGLFVANNGALLLLGAWESSTSGFFINGTYALDI